MWTSEIVKARFIEAAHSEQFLPNAKMSNASGYWPAHLYTKDDRDGWDDMAKQDNAERWKGRAPDGAISRHQECMNWIADFINDEYRSKLLWGYAFCKARKHDFGKLCDRKGWARRTAYLRLNRIFTQLAADLNNDRRMLRLPANQWLAHEQAIGASSCATIEIADAETAAIQFTPGYRTEPSRDLIQSQADADLFAEFLDRRNAEVRAVQAREAKRRQKLGLYAA